MKRACKEFEVSILNDSYKVYVYLGDKNKSERAIQKYLGIKDELFSEENRGRCVYKRKFHPCIWIDSSLPYQEAVGTLAHEAIHAVSDVMDYLEMDARDTSGNEFLAHSVAAIIRKYLKVKKS